MHLKIFPEVEVKKIWQKDPIFPYVSMGKIMIGVHVDHEYQLAGLKFL